MPAYITNTATFEGRDPNGDVVTPSPQPSADVQALTPHVVLTKTPSASVVSSGDSVTYTYTVANDGNASLSGVTISDDTAPCSSASNISGPTKGTPDNGDSLLDPGETWTYTCTASLTESTGNVATVTAQPVEPDGTTPIGDPVTDTAEASVEVVNPDLELVRTASPTVGLPGTSFTYTYELTNTGDTALEPTYGNTEHTGILTDDACDSVSYMSGDTNGNGRLDPAVAPNPAETWTYTCQTSYSAAASM